MNKDLVLEREPTNRSDVRISLKKSTCRILFASKESPNYIEPDPAQMCWAAARSPNRRVSNNLESVASRIAKSPLM